MKYFKSFIPLTLNKGILITLLALGAVSWLPLCANHGEHRVDADSRLSGNSLEYDLWNSVQTQNKDVLAELISPIFLGGNIQGIRNYDNEIATLRNLSITSFVINNVVESQDEDIRIIAYDFTAAGPASINDHRISVWQRKKHKHHQFFWQLISHSSFSINP